MRVVPTELPGVLRLFSPIYRDARGWFSEAFHTIKSGAAIDPNAHFVQDNQSHSRRNVLRGMHYQVGAHPQGKLVRVLAGSIFDVAVDLRRHSPAFGKWVGVELASPLDSSDELEALWIPPGFAHGFLVLSGHADVFYKTTNYYDPSGDRSLAWNDPRVAIKWPLTGPPILSEKDAAAPTWQSAEKFD
jgi:dTDP-4-dehydrorhamnose 3,5-epimerase